MAYITHKLELYKSNPTGGWSTTALEIEEFHNKSVIKNIGNKKDTFSFQVTNYANHLFINGAVFEKGDRVKIYQGFNKEKTALDITDILIDGIINDVEQTMNNSNIVRISGKSRTEQLLEGLTFIDSGNSNWDIPTIIENSLNFHNNNNEFFQITYGSNPTLTSKSLAFPSYPVKTFYKPMYQTLELYLSDVYTGDGNYYYYVNDNNELIWRREEKASDFNLDETECNNIKIAPNKQVINSVIIYCGYSPSGKRIRTQRFEISSRNKDGAKWKFLTETNVLANDIMLNERRINSSSFTSSSGLFPASYPYTTTFGVLCNNDGDFDDAIKDEAIKQGKIIGQKVIDQSGFGKLKATATIPFTRTYLQGSIFNCNFPTHNVNSLPLRAVEVQYTDFETILYFEQDKLE